MSAEVVDDVAGTGAGTASLGDLHPVGDETGHRGDTRLLWFAPVGGAFGRFLDDVACCPDVEPLPGAAEPTQTVRGHGVTWGEVSDARAAREYLERNYVNALIMDLRCLPEQAGDFERRVRAGMDLLDGLDRTRDVETRYGFHRILVLLSGPEPERVDRLIAQLGMRGIEHVLRFHGDPGVPEDAARFARRAVDEALRLVHGRARGKTALCCAGGGITGIFFELGALKCLQDVLPPGTLNRFDMYFGISAGAVVTSYLASGYSVDEVMAAIAGVPGGRIPPLDLRLLSWRNLDLAELRRRLMRAARMTVGGLREAARHRRLPALDSMLYHAGEIIAPPFHSRNFAAMVQRALELPGASNDFRRLPRPLYIGASDQDARQHVLFGSEGLTHVPIHKALEASISFNPAFGSTCIEGRCYEDGAVTRTSNFEEAIRRGARLVVVLDPFVPYVSREPGFSAERGMLYNVDQNVRTISYTRFEMARNWILRKHPEVSSYTFLPSNTIRKLMSTNPMDHRPYMAIWRAAYRSTLRRIHRLEARLSGDLRVFGLAVDTTVADVVYEQLEHIPVPAFADLYPGGRVELARPRLCQDPPARSTTQLDAA